jgi:hypothetical protein
VDYGIITIKTRVILKRKTTEEFIVAATKVHGDKDNYSKVEYKTAHIKVLIICHEHGEFWQSPNHHLSDQGCPTCGSENRAQTRSYTLAQFIIKAAAVHNDKYCYDEVHYKNNSTKVCVVCNEHGKFWQTPAMHLSGQGCPICAEKTRAQTRSYTTEEFLAKAIEIHGNKYDYSKTVYIHNKVKVSVICYEHGEFLQAPNKHLSGQGCRHTTEHSANASMQHSSHTTRLSQDCEVVNLWKEDRKSVV